jgi:hypothetical protein
MVRSPDISGTLVVAVAATVGDTAVVAVAAAVVGVVAAAVVGVVAAAAVGVDEVVDAVAADVVGVVAAAVVGVDAAAADVGVVSSSSPPQAAIMVTSISTIVNPRMRVIQRGTCRTNTLPAIVLLMYRNTR